jgi:hypothetical protein
VRNRRIDGRRETIVSFLAKPLPPTEEEHRHRQNKQQQRYPLDSNHKNLSAKPLKFVAKT